MCSTDARPETFLIASAAILVFAGFLSSSYAQEIHAESTSNSWSLGTAVRLEDFEGFGTTMNSKLESANFQTRRTQ